MILGNPPWLSYRYIAEPEYQAEVKKSHARFDDYGIAPRKQKLLTQMELATVFLAHALKVFGKPASKETKHPGARLAFVMPRSVLTADQHALFRNHRHKAPVTITAYWDLFEVKPLFNVPSCVIFAERTEKGKLRKPDATIPALEWSGRLPERDAAWEAAEPKLECVKKKARIITLGQPVGTIDVRSRSLRAGR